MKPMFHEFIHNEVSKTMDKVPVSLIIDDSGPVNMFHFHQLEIKHELLVPPAFLKRFATLCQRLGIKGKFSMVPMPAGLGRLDGKLAQVPPSYVKNYISIVKEEIEPIFSITPEILTHYLAYDMKTGRFMHICEDTLFSKLNAEEIAEYVGLALEILGNVGLNPTGVTSPWLCGIDNEDNYARGIGMAFRKVKNVSKCFYFLHCRDEVNKPTLMCDTPETGRVISIPDNTFDAFWATQKPVHTHIAVKNARTKIDELLSNDGKTGLIRKLFEQKLPITLISHWQSLFSDGRGIGLQGLETLVNRINNIFGDSIQWMTFEELANHTEA